MSYLMADDYDLIIAEVVSKLDSIRTAHYFHAKYKENKADNPDFIWELEYAIERLQDRLRYEIGLIQNRLFKPTDEQMKLVEGSIFPIRCFYTDYSFDTRKIGYLSIQYLLEAWIILFNTIDNSESESNAEKINKDLVKNNNKKQPTKLTQILQLYFENDCKVMEKSAVMGKLNNGKASGPMINKFNDVKGDGFTHNGNPNSVRAFKESYLYLIEVFKNKENLKALKQVENCYKTLIEVYPDLTN